MTKRINKEKMRREKKTKDEEEEKIQEKLR